MGSLKRPRGSCVSARGVQKNESWNSPRGMIHKGPLIPNHTSTMAKWSFRTAMGKFWSQKVKGCDDLFRYKHMCIHLEISCGQHLCARWPLSSGPLPRRGFATAAPLLLRWTCHAVSRHSAPSLCCRVSWAPSARRSTRAPSLSAGFELLLANGQPKLGRRPARGERSFNDPCQHP